MHKLRRIKVRIKADETEVYLLGQTARGTSFPFDVCRVPGALGKDSPGIAEVRTFIEAYESKAAAVRAAAASKP